MPSYPDTLGKLQDLEVSYDNCEHEVEISETWSADLNFTWIEEPVKTIELKIADIKFQEGRYNSEAKDSYQYNIREYNDRIKVSI